MQSGFPLPGQFSEYRNRVELYLARIMRFPYDWGLPSSASGPLGMPTQLFRYDAKRLKRMVLGAEHCIRCLIIWLASVRLHHKAVAPRNVIPLPPSEGWKRAEPEPPPHHLFSLRALPLREPKLPPFRVSLPSEADDHSRDEETFHDRFASRKLTSGKRGRRVRNDDELSCELLFKRADRLGRLLDQIDTRAESLAAYWAGWLTPAISTYRAELARRIERASGEASDTTSSGAPDLTGLKRPVLDPLKNWEPPPEILDGAPPDETEDLRALHDVACRSAEGFYNLCG